MDVPFYHAMIKYINYWNAKSFTNAISMMDKSYMSNKIQNKYFFPRIYYVTPAWLCNLHPTSLEATWYPYII